MNNIALSNGQLELFDYELNYLAKTPILGNIEWCFDATNKSYSIIQIDKDVHFNHYSMCFFQSNGFNFFGRIEKSDRGERTTKLSISLDYDSIDFGVPILNEEITNVEEFLKNEIIKNNNLSKHQLPFNFEIKSNTNVYVKAPNNELDLSVLCDQILRRDNVEVRVEYINYKINVTIEKKDKAVWKFSENEVEILNKRIKMDSENYTRCTIYREIDFDKYEVYQYFLKKDGNITEDENDVNRIEYDIHTASVLRGSWDLENTVLTPVDIEEVENEAYNILEKEYNNEIEIEYNLKNNRELFDLLNTPVELYFLNGNFLHSKVTKVTKTGINDIIKVVLGTSRTRQTDIIKGVK